MLLYGVSVQICLANHAGIVNPNVHLLRNVLNECASRLDEVRVMVTGHFYPFLLQMSVHPHAAWLQKVLVYTVSTRLTSTSADLFSNVCRAKMTLCSLHWRRERRCTMCRTPIRWTISRRSSCSEILIRCACVGAFQAAHNKALLAPSCTLHATDHC